MNKQLYIILLFAFLVSVSSQFRVLQETDDQDLTCYGLIFDAGSSSTKMQIYNWPCRTTDTVPKINPQQVEVQKAKPGIATFADDLDGIDNYLGGLIDYANNHIYEGDRQYTPIMLFGTAGLRVIPEEDQKKIIEKVNDIFKRSGYLYNSNWIKIITGQEEGASMWTSVNYLLGTLDETPESERFTAITIDLGGASTQIAFGPKREMNQDYNLLIDFPNFNNYNIYSVSYLGFGNDMERNIVIDQQGTWSEDKKTVSTPCYYNGYEGKYGENDEIVLKGTGNPQQCREQIIQTFELDKCSKIQKFFGCGLLGTYQPLVPYTKPIYALSGITKAVDFFDLNTKPYTPQELLDKSIDLCSQSWEQIQKDYPDNEYIDTQCFLTMYSATLMIDGYNISPKRLVNSPDEINGVEPSWTLGAMFYAVSQMPCKEESPLCKMAKLLYPQMDHQEQIKEIYV